MRITHLALHACCTPCTIKSYEWLCSGQAQTRTGEPLACEHITLLFYNPNIAPAAEYERRRDALMAYCAHQGIDAFELEYRPELWEEATAADRRAGVRCRQCYRLRLGRVAQWADAHGAEALTTTLTISPYQQTDTIAEEGQRAAEAFGLRYLDIDFSPLYRAGQQAARDLGIYMQNYCGCLPSKNEAEEQRAARRAVRQAERAARRAGLAPAAGRTGEEERP